MFEPVLGWRARLWLVLLNGHVLPGFRLIGRRRALPVGARGNARRALGAARLTYHRADGARITLRHSKARAIGPLLRHLILLLRLALGYQRIQSQWIDAYARLTRPEFWAQHFPPKEAA